MAAKKRDVHYVDNRAFYEALVDYKKQCREAAAAGKPKPRVSSYIGSCIMKIAEKFSHRPNFIGYSYRDEMVADAIDNCIAYGVEKFDPDRTDKPFSYFTQITFNAFRLRIQKEKKQQYIKYKSLEIASTTGDLVEHAVHEENGGSGASQVGGAGKSEAQATIRSFVDHARRFVGTYEESMENRKQKRKGGLEAFIDTDAAQQEAPAKKGRFRTGPRGFRKKSEL